MLRRDVDEPLLRYLEQVVFDVEATRQAIRDEHARRSAENGALLADAERAVAQVEASLLRVRDDYLNGRIGPEDWGEFRAHLSEQHVAAQSEMTRLRTRTEEVTSEAAALDVDDELAARIAALREAAAGEVVGAEGLDAVRTALKRVFTKITIVRTPEGELLLVPEAAAFHEIEAWVRLADGRTAVKPLPQTLAVPEQQRVTGAS